MNFVPKMGPHHTPRWLQASIEHDLFSQELLCARQDIFETVQALQEEGDISTQVLAYLGFATFRVVSGRCRQVQMAVLEVHLFNLAQAASVISNLHDAGYLRISLP